MQTASVPHVTTPNTSWLAPDEYTTPGVYNMVRARQYFEAIIRIVHPSEAYGHVSVRPTNGKDLFF